MRNTQSSANARATNHFALWLRTGRWVPAQLTDPALEVKFNPNHDPADGRFTFKDGVGGSASMSKAPPSPPRQLGKEDPRIVAADREREARFWAADARNPKNQESYTVKVGDNLTKIAARRTNLSPADLAWLNGLNGDTIKPGQTIRIPSQASFNFGRQTVKDSQAYVRYMGNHGGNLPPVGIQPDYAVERFGPGAHVEKRNGYSFTVDGQGRTRLVEGTITRTSTPVRNRKVQADAGTPDRLATDQGGHYIAARFNGPAEAFNHFAQNENFNKSAYKTLENEWAKRDRRGEKVYITITPTYSEASKRPALINVDYAIAGFHHVESFVNRSRK